MTLLEPEHSVSVMPMHSPIGSPTPLLQSSPRRPCYFERPRPVYPRRPPAIGIRNVLIVYLLFSLLHVVPLAGYLAARSRPRPGFVVPGRGRGPEQGDPGPCRLHPWTWTWQPDETRRTRPPSSRPAHLHCRWRGADGILVRGRGAGVFEVVCGPGIGTTRNSTFGAWEMGPCLQLRTSTGIKNRGWGMAKGICSMSMISAGKSCDMRWTDA